MFIVDLLNHAEEFARAKAEVIIVTSSDAETAKRYEPPEHFPFRLVPDPDMEIYRMYGVKMKAKGFTWNVFRKSAMFVKYLPKYNWVKGGLAGPHLQPPACFVIDSAGIIRYSHIGKDVADNPDAGKLVKIFEDINKAQ
jgi:peroxiredoxin